MQEVFYIIFVQNFTVLESKDHENQLSLELITMSIRRIQITDLSWTDILFPNVLPLLSVQVYNNTAVHIYILCCYIVVCTDLHGYEGSALEDDFWTPFL